MVPLSQHPVPSSLTSCGIQGLNTLEQNLQDAAEKVIKEIKSLQLNQQDPIIVAIDGGSGAGKSTLATRIEGDLDTALIPLDDFFSGHIPDNQWDALTVEAKLEHVFDQILCQSSGGDGEFKLKCQHFLMLPTN